MSLHERIQEYSKSRKNEVCVHLLALKWVGNSASRGNSLEVDEIPDSFEILAHALSEIYSTRKAKAGKLAKVINKRKGAFMRYR